MIKELNIPQTEWQIGRTKVFLRSVIHEPLEDARKQMINSKAIIIQTMWRRHLERRNFSKIKKAVLLIQHAYIGWKLRIEFLRKRRAAIVIQSHLRGVFAREVHFLFITMIVLIIFYKRNYFHNIHHKHFFLSIFTTVLVYPQNALSSYKQKKNIRKSI